MTRYTRVCAFSIMVALGGSLSACSSGTPPAEEPQDPPLDDEPGGSGGPVAPASSEKVQQGIDKIQAGDFEAAKQALTEAVAENDKDPQAHYYLGVCLQQLGDGGGAVREYRKALDLDPRLLEASVNLSAALLETGDAAGALSAAEKGLAADPKNGALLLNKAMALQQTGKAAEAAEAFGAASKAAPNDAEVRFMYAEALAQAGDEQKARAELEAIESDKVEVLASAARLLGKLKAFDQCIAALDKVLAKNKMAELFVQRGICKHGKKDEKGAQADYEAAIAADPKLAAAQFYLGQHLRLQKDKKGAKKALEKAVELDPKGPIGAAAKKELAEL